MLRDIQHRNESSEHRITHTNLNKPTRFISLYGFTTMLCTNLAVKRSHERVWISVGGLSLRVGPIAVTPEARNLVPGHEILAPHHHSVMETFYFLVEMPKAKP